MMEMLLAVQQTLQHPDSQAWASDLAPSQPCTSENQTQGEQKVFPTCFAKVPPATSKPQGEGIPHCYSTHNPLAACTLQQGSNAVFQPDPQSITVGIKTRGDINEHWISPFAGINLSVASVGLHFPPTCLFVWLWILITISISPGSHWCGRRLVPPWFFSSFLLKEK